MGGGRAVPQPGQVSMHSAMMTSVDSTEPSWVLRARRPTDRTATLHTRHVAENTSLRGAHGDAPQHRPQERLLGGRDGRQPLMDRLIARRGHLVVQGEPFGGRLRDADPAITCGEGADDQPLPLQSVQQGDQRRLVDAELRTDLRLSELPPSPTSARTSQSRISARPASRHTASKTSPSAAAARCVSQVRSAVEGSPVSAHISVGTVRRSLGATRHHPGFSGASIHHNMIQFRIFQSRIVLLRMIPGRMFGAQGAQGAHQVRPHTRNSHDFRPRIPYPPARRPRRDQ